MWISMCVNSKSFGITTSSSFPFPSFNYGGLNGFVVTI